MPEGAPGRRSDWLIYVLAGAAGLFTGWVDLRVRDLLFTALLVSAFCMLLGIMRPVRPWRWVAIIGICVPIAVVVGYFVLVERPNRAQIWESFLAFLPGVAPLLARAPRLPAPRRCTAPTPLAEAVPRHRSRMDS